MGNIHAVLHSGDNRSQAHSPHSALADLPLELLIEIHTYVAHDARLRHNLSRPSSHRLLSTVTATNLGKTSKYMQDLSAKVLFDEEVMVVDIDMRNREAGLRTLVTELVTNRFLVDTLGVGSNETIRIKQLELKIRPGRPVMRRYGGVRVEHGISFQLTCKPHLHRVALNLSSDRENNDQAQWYGTGAVQYQLVKQFTREIAYDGVPLWKGFKLADVVRMIDLIRGTIFCKDGYTVKLHSLLNLGEVSDEGIDIVFGEINEKEGLWE